MRIAIASSGLGHVARGVETWARDTADALHARGVDVTLFCGAPLAGESGVAPRVVVRCIKRFSWLSRVLVRLMPGFVWRWGLKSGYGLEQLTFWWGLRKLLRQGDFDVLHVQDPMVAWWCRRARLAGNVRTKEILAHGTEESAEFLGQFDYVQHLLGWHLEKVVDELGGGEALAESQSAQRDVGAGEFEQKITKATKRGVPKGWWVAPNFVDVEKFAPLVGCVGIEQKVTKETKSGKDRREIRRRLGIPEDAFVAGSAGAIKMSHKRMDYLVREFALFEQKITKETKKGIHLVIAGAREAETDEVMRLGQELLGDKVTFLVDYPFEKMPEFYRALDVFVLPSLFEMMGIVFVEAMASGVPAIGHDHPVMREVIGDGGWCVDLKGEGVLAELLGEISRRAAEDAERMGARARRQAVERFGKDVVIERYVEYYERIVSGKI